jgi:hypothetical protein
MAQRRRRSMMEEAALVRLLLSLLAVIIILTAPCFATAFQIQASVSVPQQSSSTTHHDTDIIKIESLVKEKLDRIATSYQTIHGEKLRRTCDVELELCQKIERCFMGASNNNAFEEESTQSLLLSTKLKEKKSRLEECLAVNDRVVRQLLATSNSEGGQSSSLFDHVDFITSAAVAAGSTVGEYDDLGQLMGNGGLVQGGESNKETDGYDTALQIIHHTARDWTLGAAPCREETIMWIVRAIVQYYTHDSRCNDHDHHHDHQLRVLIPGAGLGRLAYEVSTCRELIENGVVPHVEANDSSVTMIFAAQNVIKMLQQQQQQYQEGRSHELNSAIYPFLSDPQVNEIDARKRFEMEVFPDQPAIDSYKYYHDLMGTNPNLSFTIGDFVSTYSQQSKRNQYDVVATSFFIDTATNIYEYIYIIKHMLDDSTNGGGIWVNCGPVQWHPCALLRPTVEQLKDMLQVAGFELISWSIADEAVAYRHPEDVGGTGLEARYTRSEAYRPLRFVARLMAGGDNDGSNEDLALKIQYSEFLNEVANGKIEVD